MDFESVSRGAVLAALMDFESVSRGAALAALIAGCSAASAPPGPVPDPGLEPAGCPVGHTAGLDGRCMAVGIQGCVEAERVVAHQLVA
jgi:hypothetical protein